MSAFLRNNSNDLEIIPERKKVRPKKAKQKQEELVVGVKDLKKIRDRDHELICMLEIDKIAFACCLMTKSFIATLEEESYELFKLIIEEKLANKVKNPEDLQHMSNKVIASVLNQLPDIMADVDTTEKPTKTKKALRTFSVALPQ